MCNRIHESRDSLLNMAVKAFFVAVVVVTTLSLSNAWARMSGYAVLAVSTSNGSTVDKQICAGTSGSWNGSIPSLSRPLYWQPVVLPSGWNDPYGCYPNDSTPVSETDAVVLRQGGCSFYKKALTARHLGGNLTVVVNSNDTLFGPNPGNVTTPLDHMEAILISYQDGDWLWNQANRSDASSLKITVYIPPSNLALSFIPTAAVMWIIALTIIISGSLIAQSSSEFLVYGLVWRKGEVPDDVINPKDNLKKWQSVIVAIVTVAIMFGFFLLLYFFWHVMIYVVVALFTLLGTYCLFLLLSPWIALIPILSNLRVPEFRYSQKIPILQYRPDPRFFVTLAVCAFVAVWWAVVRNTSYGWILLLVLAYAINIRIIKVWSRLRKLLVIAVLMCIMFVYDIFMVFITPLITGDNKSVMEKLALGGEINGIGDPTCETLPISIRVPFFIVDDLSKVCSVYTSCLSGYMILGFGDIAIPGILVSFCLYVDKTYHPKRKFKVYFCIALIGYAVGLIATYIALVLMETGQPALLYLVPCTLLPTLISALAHREFKQLLLGPRKEEPQTQEEGGSGSGKQTSELETVATISVEQEGEEEEEEDPRVGPSEEKHLLEETATTSKN